MMNPTQGPSASNNSGARTMPQVQLDLFPIEEKSPEQIEEENRLHLQRMKLEYHKSVGVPVPYDYDVSRIVEALKDISAERSYLYLKSLEEDQGNKRKDAR